MCIPEHTQVDYPPVFTDMTESMVAVQGDFSTMLSFKCAQPYTHYTRLLFYTITPGLLALVNLAVYLALRFVVFRSDAQMQKRVYGDCLAALLVLSFLVYPGVSVVIFKSLFCVEFEDGSSALKADYSVDCNADDRFMWVAYACLMVRRCRCYACALLCLRLS